MTHKVMVADNDFDNRTIAKESLEASGYDVILATDGEEALALIQSQRPEVVLLDLSMPKMNGWEVAKRVREIPEVANIAIVAFTAHALAGNELKARAAGCDDYISKPCMPRDLVAKAAFWIEKKKAEAA